MDYLLDYRNFILKIWFEKNELNLIQSIEMCIAMIHINWRKLVIYIAITVNSHAYQISKTF